MLHEAPRKEEPPNVQEAGGPIIAIEAHLLGHSPRQWLLRRRVRAYHIPVLVRRQLLQLGLQSQKDEHAPRVSHSESQLKPNVAQLSREPDYEHEDGRDHDHDHEHRHGHEHKVSKLFGEKNVLHRFHRCCTAYTIDLP